MSKIISELSNIVGTYTDKEGNKKNKYHRLGSIIDTPQGHMLKIDSIPVCDPPWSGWAWINPPKERTINFDKKDDDIGF